ncbi:MAG: GIY-YIG nuclease family protein [candidate division KSB1 bacterium]|jgi:putative endonuclease|nr:GIY-YIG nuclease family protein [candidate division KSB1 bacterium]
MFYVYIIESEEGKYYTGSTNDISKRIEQHNSNKFRCWTNRYSNWTLVYSESFETRSEAIKRENEIKKMKGGVQFKKLVGS